LTVWIYAFKWYLNARPSAHKAQSAVKLGRM
jgi:hypothetical protein